MGRADYLKKGSWNVTCMRCSGKFKAEDIRREEWTGLLVCKDCLDTRNPQDFLWAGVDDQTIPFSNPPPEPVFIEDIT